MARIFYRNEMLVPGIVAIVRSAGYALRGCSAFWRAGSPDGTPQDKRPLTSFRSRPACRWGPIARAWCGEVRQNPSNHDDSTTACSTAPYIEVACSVGCRVRSCVLAANPCNLPAAHRPAPRSLSSCDGPLRNPRSSSPDVYCLRKSRIAIVAVRSWRCFTGGDKNDDACSIPTWGASWPTRDSRGLRQLPLAPEFDWHRCSRRTGRRAWIHERPRRA